MEQTGTQLGAYRLYEKIGGGFATVYVARDTRTNEMVAQGSVSASCEKRSRCFEEKYGYEVFRCVLCNPEES